MKYYSKYWKVKMMQIQIQMKLCSMLENESIFYQITGKMTKRGIYKIYKNIVLQSDYGEYIS